MNVYAICANVHAAPISWENQNFDIALYISVAVPLNQLVMSSTQKEPSDVLNIYDGTALLLDTIAFHVRLTLILYKVGLDDNPVNISLE